MSDIEEVYQCLINKGFSEEELNNEIKRKKSEFHGFITEQGALFLIAKEKGLKIQSPDIDPDLYSEIEKEIDYNEFTMPLSDLQEGMSNIVILGKITNIFQIKSFIRKDNTPGLVGSFILADTSGSIKIVVWGEHVKIIDTEFFQKGEIVRVINGYSKKGLNGGLEIHMGKIGTLILAPSDIDDKIKKQLQKIELGNGNGYSLSHVNSTHIKDLFNKEGFIDSVSGYVKIDDFKEFNKKNGEKSFLLKFQLIDDTGNIIVLVWDLKAIEVLKSIENDILIKISNVMIKNNDRNNEKEVHFTKRSKIKII